MEKKLNLGSLIIEITRKCNFQCSHCLRGTQQNRVINLKHVKTLFQKVNYISTITFSGGEPFLYPEKIMGILKLAKEYEVEIGNFYIATNGTIQGDKILLCILKWYQYCTENEISMIKISMDYHHQANWKSDQTKYDIISFWKAFSFVEFNEHDYTSYVQEGFAQFKTGRPAYVSSELDVDMVYDNFQINLDNEIYLNCNGHIILGCDLSYDSQTRHIFCHVEHFNELAMKAGEKYVREEEERNILQNQAI